MILLARKMTTQDVTGFLLSSGILVFILGVVLLWAVFQSLPAAVIVSGLGAISYVAGGIYSRPLSIAVYRRWNQLAKRVGSLVRWWVSLIAFHVIVRAVGQSSENTHQQERTAGRSFWQERETLSADAYLGQYNRAYRGSRQGAGWVADYLKWCFASRNGWFVFLLPFLLVLRAVAGERAPELPENVYTLY